jgi:hypothetical protein
MTVSQETRALARELYVIDGLTFEQAAERTNVNAATLKRWASKEDWFKRRKDHQRDSADLKTNLIKLRNRVLENTMKTLDPQGIYAVLAIEKLLMGKGLKPDQPEIPDKPMTKEELLKFIKEEVYGL